ncbi:hypothetical protein ACLM5J_03650 [Nocardioides sp. Bht2]|uniref:hypothetical protein n=1 Tax=Nocardioides sp. Bht2 TaxID=3392297 RepID=UPI0039B6AD62
MTTIPDHVPTDLHQPAQAPDYTDAEIQEFARVGHQFDAPESFLRRNEMLLLGIRMRPAFCHHCRPDYRLRPQSGTGWGIEWFHADDCPGVDE